MKNTAALHRFSVVQASAELNLTVPTLRKLLKAKRIEPSGPGGFTLAEILRAVTPEAGNASELSLQAHGRLQQSRARLIEHQLHEREERFVEREAALGFLETFMRRIYDFVYYHGGLIEAVRKELELEIQEVGIRCELEHGWALQPQYSYLANGESAPADPAESENRRVIWQRAVNAVLASVATNGENENGKQQDHTAARARVGARRDRVRHHPTNHLRRTAIHPTGI